MSLLITSSNQRPKSFHEDQRLWDRLVDQIWNGNVIPVIGDNLILEEKTTISDELVKYLSQKYQLESGPENFSELYYDRDFADYRSGLYEEISSLIESNQSNFHPSLILRDFLSIEQFPFVITTSVDYTVEETMREIWGRRNRSLRTLVFRNDPSANDDIGRSSEIHQPTVYYMFGKASSWREHSFVLTDEDMLSFSQSWLSDRHPQNLSKVIADKYLLFLGVNYPDWFIRFLWFSMRQNLRGSGMLVDDREIESSLVSFFRRVSVRTQQEPRSVLREILPRLEQKRREHERNKFKHVAEGCDFFISYSRRDEAWALALYEALTRRGYNVWYDRENITVGSDWELSIRKGIRTARHFIALLSERIAQEAHEEHPYRIEWETALAHRLSDRNFVLPVSLENTDFYNDNRLNLPLDFKSIHSLTWPSLGEVEAVVDQLTANL